MLLLVLYSHLQAQTIATIAGNGTIGRTGDGGPAATAQVFYPYGITNDKAGNLYIADDYNYCIRKINPYGIISTIAGSAQTGFEGENGPATAALFAEITGVAVDGLGYIYIADNGNRRIRAIRLNGNVVTIAGNGSEDYYGDGGRAIDAGLGNGPMGIITNPAGDIIFSDNSNVRMINTAGIITRIAGNGTETYSGDGGPATAAGLMKPKGLAIDKAGNIYVADYDNNRVRKINKAGIITTFAGNGYMSEPGFGAFYGDGGPATDASLSGPTAIAVDVAGNVFISDCNNHCVREVYTSGIINTIAGTGVNDYGGDNGPAKKAKFLSTAGLTIDANGNLYICDPVNNRIRIVTNAGAREGASSVKN